MQNPDAKFADVVGTSVTLKAQKSEDDDEQLVKETLTPPTTNDKLKYTANDIEF